ncbi:MAG: aminotransferase class V-fold PLP-dependent enzyme [Cyclobacteriaceae bacterium]|nr:aminotransferase class V-fold PLP-dependent enzyme [Cyclobacteriaceae bacterium HetDA_MAG_MS6]
MNERRKFIQKIAGTTALTMALPTLAMADSDFNARWTALKTFSGTDKKYWQLVKSQYSIEPGLIMMNAGNFCPSPYPVSKAMTDHLDHLNANASSQDRKKYKRIYANTTKLIADYLGASIEEIGITRNTSESNNTINSGLDLKSGDEVIYWSQNHQTLNIAWEARAKRAGFKAVKVVTPKQPKTEEDLIKPFVDAMTKRTRLICFSHISNQSGTLIPAMKLCEIARQRGILSLVDGAQTFGFMNIDVKDMGCDFYTGSAHKWLTGPKESGVLYIRKEVLPKVWPLIISKDWTWENEGKIENLIRYGQRNDATIAAFGEAIEFHNIIGKSKVETRVREITNQLKDAIAKIPGATFVTPTNPDMYACMLVFNLDGIDSDAAVELLYQKYGIAAAGTHDGFNGIRLTPNIYNTEKEVDQVVDVLKALHI